MDGAQAIARNTVILALARIIDRSTTLILTLVLARTLGATGVGTYSIALAFYGVIAIAGEAGATLFLIRELSLDRSRTGTYVVHLSLMAVAVSALLIVVAEVVILHVGYAPAVRSSVAIVLLAILPKTLNSIQEGVFVVYGRTEFETLTTLVASGLYLGVSLWLLSTGHGVASILLVYVAVEYAVTVVYFVLIRSRITRLPLSVSWATTKRLAGQIKAFTGTAALAALFQRPEVVILSVMSGARAVGFYSIAVRLTEIWLFVPEVFMNNVFPALTRAVHAGEDRFGHIQATAVRWTLAYALPLSAGLVAVAAPLVRQLFGARFAPSVGPLQVMAINITLFSTMEVLWRSVSARGGQSTLLRVQLIIIATRLSTGVVAIALLGSLGAALSATASAGLHMLLLLWILARAGVAPRLVRISWRFALSAAGMGALTWWLSGETALWVVISVAAAVYLGAVVMLRAVPGEEARAIRGLLPHRSGVAAG